MNQVKEKNLTNSNLSANRPSPGLTLESLSFKNFPKNIQSSKRQFIHQKQIQPKTQTKDFNKNNLNKYTKSIKNDELQKNIANYELFFEKVLYYFNKLAYFE